MTKEEIYKKVTDKVNPMIKATSRWMDGEEPCEEFGEYYWTKEDLRKIADEIFEETYKLSNATNPENRK